jgi:hypothetical protein
MRNLTDHLNGFPPILEGEALSQPARNRAFQIIDAARKGKTLNQDEEDFLRIYARLTNSKKTKIAIQHLNISYEEEEENEALSDFLPQGELASKAINYIREAEKDRFSLTLQLVNGAISSYKQLNEILSRELENERKESRRKDELLIKILSEKSIDFDFSTQVKEQMKNKMTDYLIQENVPKEKAPSIAKEFFEMLLKFLPSIAEQKLGVKLTDSAPSSAPTSQAAE